MRWHCVTCEDVAWMREHGASLGVAAARVGTTEAALEKHLRFAKRVTT